MYSLTISCQTFEFKKMDFPLDTTDSGKYKDYIKYDIPGFWFLNGAIDKNLNFKIVDKASKRFVYDYPQHQSDAMILKPIFFCNPDTNIIVILVEIASEFSWGQEVLLWKEKTIKYIGFLDYMADVYNHTSIANYCHISMNKDKIIMTFDNVPIYYNPQDSEKIMGKDLKFDITEKVLRIK